MMTSLGQKLATCGKTLRTASAVPWNQSSEDGVCSAANTSTKPLENVSNRYVFEMCWLSEAELNCVST